MVFLSNDVFTSFVRSGAIHVLALTKAMCWHSHNESAKIQLMFTISSHNEHIAGVS